MDSKPIQQVATYQVPQNEASAVAERKGFDVEPEPYRFNFSQHKGNLLEEVPPHFLQWIIKKNIAAKRPDLKKALESYNPTTTEKPPVNPPSTSTPKPKNELSSIKAETPHNAPLPGDFVLNFGKYRYRKISDPEIDPSYLDWLSTNTSSGFSAECSAAVRAYLSSLSTPSSLKALEDWSPPRLSHAPSKFWDGEDLWISNNDTRRTFSLHPDQMVKLPLVSRKAQGGRERYWLYHVWDLARVLKGRNAADRGLEEFLSRYRDKVEDVWASMGLP